MLKIFNFILMFIFYFPFFTYGETIKTTIVCNTKIFQDKITINGEIINKSDIAVYNVVAVIYLDEKVDKYELGDNPPHGNLNFKTEFMASDLKPGDYTIVIRVYFEERNGAPHKVYHQSKLRYKIDNAVSKLVITVKPPHINKRAIFQKKESFFDVTLVNNHNDAIKPFIYFFLPDGFSLLKGIVSIELSPGKKEKIQIPLEMEFLQEENVKYIGSLWYEYDGMHFSIPINGEIELIEKPLYFGLYLKLSIAIIFFLFCIIFASKKLFKAHFI
ncbi:MAG: hypothetical protein HQK79_15685 [Desulfobacterales bacterium]|nr:hypothetical protein [Desulfobacterales bacterium]